MMPQAQRALHAQLDALEVKVQLVGWQINMYDCDVTFARIERAMVAGYGRDGREVPGGLLSRAAVDPSSRGSRA